MKLLALDTSSISCSVAVKIDEAIIERYKSLREDGERFLDTYRRVGIEPFKEAVYGPKERRAVA